MHQEKDLLHLLRHARLPSNEEMRDEHQSPTPDCSDTVTGEEIKRQTAEVCDVLRPASS